MADGLATDRHHLLFSRCVVGEIGRVNRGGGGLAFITLPPGSCPQGLAVGGGELYGAEVGGHVGRATLQGTHIVSKWLNIHTNQGPFDLAADRDDRYWDWGGASGSPLHIGRVRVSGRRLHSILLAGQGSLPAYLPRRQQLTLRGALPPRVRRRRAGLPRRARSVRLHPIKKATEQAFSWPPCGPGPAGGPASARWLDVPLGA